MVNFFIDDSKKKRRGCTHFDDIWGMSSTERVVCTFNESSQPIGVGGRLLTRLLGTLLRNLS